MDLLYFILSLVTVALPFHCAVAVQFSRWESPEYFRRYGVIIRRPEALDEFSEVIGRYSGTLIYRSVTFKGMEYAFAGVVPPGYQARIAENELYLDPGLLYRLCGNAAAPRLARTGD